MCHSTVMKNDYQNWSHYSPPKSPTLDTGGWQQSPREFVCGWGAASINIMITFPLNKLMFRQQLHGISASQALKQLQREGLFHLYRGLLPPFFQKTTSLSVMFGMYDRYRHMLDEQCPVLPVTYNRGIAAIFAGCTEAIFAPFERVQTLMQDKKYHGKFRNTFHAFYELKAYGIREYYRGLVPVLLRNGPSNAMFFLLRGEIKALLPHSDSNAGHMAADFVSGGILGALISTAFFPVNVVKTRMQSQIGGDFLRFRDTFVTVFRERHRSLRGLFLGVHVNFTRSLISWGVINASYELLKRVLYPVDTD